jgi:queuine tRNA-ribosyltransferase
MTSRPSPFKLKARSTDCAARRGEVQTLHGTFQTPIFMPVGTQATVKAVTPENLQELGAEIILANTYHLFLRPGHELIRELGGLHRFMNWDRPILTDSGGFQIFSLRELAKITEEGAAFKSHLDGSALFLSPEDAVMVQEALGSDIMMCLDTCIPYPADREETLAATELTTRWAVRSRTAQEDTGQLLFGIVQGGMYQDLRTMAVEQLVEIGFDGYALGGLSVGEPHELMMDITEHAAKLLPQDNARNGMLFTSNGRIVIKNSQYSSDPEPPDEKCSCYTCRNYSRAYLRHLYMSREILAYHLNTIHNLHYFVGLMQEMRKAVENDSFVQFKKDFYDKRQG